MRINRRLFRLMCLLSPILITIGCPQLATEISRPVQAVWSGNDLLVAISSYHTFSPNAPYYQDDSSFDWQYRLERWPGGSSAGAQGMGTLDEGTFSAGGAIQYSRMYWNGAAGVVSVDDWSGPYLVQLAAGGARRIPLSKPGELLYLLDLAPPDYAVTTAGLSNLDTVLSPDGLTAAVLYVFAYSPEGSDDLTLYFNEIVAFHSAATGAFRYARRITAAPPQGTMSPQVGPMSWTEPLGPNRPYPIETDAPSWNRLIWEKTSSGVYAVDAFGAEGEEAAVFLAYDPDTQPLPMAVTEVPNRALPSSSGPIRDDGHAVRIVLSGNESSLVFTDVSSWEPFDSQTLVPLSQIDPSDY